MVLAVEMISGLILDIFLMQSQQANGLIFVWVEREWPSHQGWLIILLEQYEDGIAILWNGKTEGRKGLRCMGQIIITPKLKDRWSQTLNKKTGP